MGETLQATRLAALPIISIEPFLDPDDARRLSTAAALHAACSQYGFFYLDISSYVNPSEPEELIRLAREFFALPQEEKDKISLANEDGARGMYMWKSEMSALGTLTNSRVCQAQGERYRRKGG